MSSTTGGIANLPEPRRLGWPSGTRTPGRTVVVSERLPVVLRQEGAHWRAAPVRGALISALSADVLVVTPLRAGMELVAKEYCAARADRGGALVLSELAGAAAQLSHGALLVNPYNVEAVARALYRALRLKTPERAARMDARRNEVQRHDVFWWADGFLAAALREPDGMRSGLRSYV